MLLFDLHCDTITKLHARGEELFDSGSTRVNLNKAQFLDKWFQVFAIFIQDHLRGEDAFKYYSDVYKFFKLQIEKNHDYFQQSTVKRKALLAVEGGAVLAGNIKNIEILKQNDVKLLTLTWNGENELGFGTAENKGLKPFGFECVKKLEESGIAVDVSHLSDAGFYDVASISGKPFIASHSNSRSVCNNPRNLTDEQFTTISSRGGIVGMNFHKPFVTEKGDYLTSVLKHIEHFLSLGGEKCVCIGSDYDGADIVEPLYSINNTENLYNALLKINYSEELVDDIFFNNAFDFFERL